MRRPKKVPSNPRMSNTFEPNEEAFPDPLWYLATEMFIAPGVGTLT